jgi:hypothetical protein
MRLLRGAEGDGTAKSIAGLRKQRSISAASRRIDEISEKSWMPDEDSNLD